MNSLLIHNGTVVTALAQSRADILCRDGVVASIGPQLEAPQGSEVIDAQGQLVLPGCIDAHVHMELPVGDMESADDFFTGTSAAAAGGTTTILDFVSPNRGDSLLATLDLWRRKAEKACIDYGFHMAVAGVTAQTAVEMQKVTKEHGITSFKTYMAYLDTIGVRDAELIRIMDITSDLGALVTVHAEVGDVVTELQRRLVAQGNVAPRFHPQSRPAWVEAEAVARALALARINGQPLYLVHTTCSEALAAVRRARERGQRVLVETCPQYLVLDESAYEAPEFGGAAYVLSPPLRPKAEQAALWQALAASEIDTVATDHCPFRLTDQKTRGRDNFVKIPNGAGGVEDRLRLMYTHGVATGRLSLARLVDLCATRPAKIFGLYPRKGTIALGSDADLVIYNPAGESTVSAARQFQRVDCNIYEGLVVKGSITHTISQGRVVFHHGKLDVRRGAGRYLERGQPLLS